jgi:3-phosphoshikimate 1-carboxyvinyltransferase
LIEEIKIIDRFPKGIVTLPPSKSLCHRAVICAALSDGVSLIRNVSLSDDIRATIEGVKTLGAEVRYFSSLNVDRCEVRSDLNVDHNKEGVALNVDHCGEGTVLSTVLSGDGEPEASAIYSDTDNQEMEAEKEAESEKETKGGCLFIRGGIERQGDLINCIESGTTLRFLIPVAALCDRETVFEGRGRLLARPMDVYDTVFSSTLVEFSHDFRQVRVRGPLKSGVFTLPGDVSSQFVSGMLIALPLVSGDSEIRILSNLESKQYVGMTVDVMRRFGVEIDEKNNIPEDSVAGSSYFIRGNQRYKPVEYVVEADYSQAAFFLCAAALGRDVGCAGLLKDSVQGDSIILSVLEKMGANITWNQGVVSVSAEKLGGLTFDAGENPDLVPPLAALSCFAEGTSKIINAGRLRIKESDRIHALAVELSKLGADVCEGPGSLTINGKTSLRGGDVDAHNDHRIAMAMALASIRCEGQVRISGWSSVNKSYPAFWDDFERSLKI